MLNNSGTRLARTEGRNIPEPSSKKKPPVMKAKKNQRHICKVTINTVQKNKALKHLNIGPRILALRIYK